MNIILGKHFQVKCAWSHFFIYLSLHRYTLLEIVLFHSILEKKTKQIVHLEFFLKLDQEAFLSAVLILLSNIIQVGIVLQSLGVDVIIKINIKILFKI